MKTARWGCAVVAVAAMATAVLGVWLAFRIRRETATILVTDTDGMQRKAQLDRGWTAQQLDVRAVLRDVSFADRLVGIAVGEQSVMARTTDGGRHWRTVRGPEERGQSFTQAALDPTGRGWAKSRSQLLRSEDGGEHWVPVSRPTGYYFGPFCVTGPLCFLTDAPTYSATVHVSEDFGSAWRPLEAPLPANDFETVFFLDRHRGWAGKKRGIIACTKDGGKSWDTIHAPLAGDVAKLHFATPEKGWAMSAAAHGGGVAHTVDGGRTWTLQDAGIQPERRLTDMRFLNETTGFLLAEHDDRSSQVFRTVDGGRRWHVIGTLPVRLHAIGFADAQTGWAVGENGVILHYREF